MEEDQEEEEEHHLVEGVVLDRVGRQTQRLVHLHFLTSQNVTDSRKDGKKINHLTSILATSRRLLLWKVSLTSSGFMFSLSSGPTAFWGLWRGLGGDDDDDDDDDDNDDDDDDDDDEDDDDTDEDTNETRQGEAAPVAIGRRLEGSPRLHGARTPGLQGGLGVLVARCQGPGG